MLTRRESLQMMASIGLGTVFPFRAWKTGQDARISRAKPGTYIHIERGECTDPEFAWRPYWNPPIFVANGKLLEPHLALTASYATTGAKGCIAHMAITKDFRPLVDRSVYTEGKRVVEQWNTLTYEALKGDVYAFALDDKTAHNKAWDHLYGKYEIQWHNMVVKKYVVVPIQMTRL